MSEHKILNHRQTLDRTGKTVYSVMITGAFGILTHCCRVGPTPDKI